MHLPITHTEVGGRRNKSDNKAIHGMSRAEGQASRPLDKAKDTKQLQWNDWVKSVTWIQNPQSRVCKNFKSSCQGQKNNASQEKEKKNV